MTINIVLHASHAISLTPILEKDFELWLEKQPPAVQKWAQNTGFKASPQQVGVLCTAEGEIDHIFFGMKNAKDVESIAALPKKLPEGVYKIASAGHLTPAEVAYAWGLGCYHFSIYRSQKEILAKLLWEGEERAYQEVTSELKTVYLIRDLINMPAEDMGPSDLAEAVEQVGGDFGGRVNQIIGEELLAENFPAVYTVGRASVHAPRLVELQWGEAHHPLVTLVGKGVCFDSGGLDIKPASNMRLMKKDMSGAAHALGLARLIMSNQLPVQLRVLIPAVENSVSGEAYRPGDVICMRSGKTVEITNTDAEGRLILADALTAACEKKPVVLLDFATLTGAASVALGNRIAALYTPSDALAEGISKYAQQINDPVWRMPLFSPYRQFLDSKIADLSNAAETPYAGSITAALFLKEFVSPGSEWAHFDMMSWSLRDRPGHPEGAEVQAIRAVYRYLKERFA